jgi:2-polyprenyl-3-methyl-5-hydroxy-6-metoxy-1,4-benzoquinol methylase
MSNLTNRDYWESEYKIFEQKNTDYNHPLSLWLEKNIQDSNVNQTSFEVGCYPGKFSAVFGKKGYELNGVDLVDAVLDLESIYTELGFKSGFFIKGDFLNLNLDNKYDIVSSFGFIEHFTEFKDVINKQIELVKPGGIAIIEVRNFNSSIYKFLYKFLDKKVLDSHNQDAMNFDNLKNFLLDKKLEILKQEYVGNFYFRTVTYKSQIGDFVCSFLNNLKIIIELLPYRLYKRYIVFVVKIKN